MRNSGWAQQIHTAEMFVSAITIHELEHGVLLMERSDRSVVTRDVEDFQRFDELRHQSVELTTPSQPRTLSRIRCGRATCRLAAWLSRCWFDHDSDGRKLSWILVESRVPSHENGDHVAW